MTWERFFLSWLTQSTFPPLLWHGSLLWVGTSVWAWKVAFGPEYRGHDRMWVEGTSLQLKVTFQTPLHTWGSDAQRRLHSSDFARHEWEWKVRASYPICRSPLPPHSPTTGVFSDSLRFFFFLLRQHLECPNEVRAVAALLIYLCVYSSWLSFDTNLHPLFSVPSTFPFF